MRILNLKLRGSIGIKKGLGVDQIEVDFTKFQPGLIALTGRNGSGKTTIMENLHPYRCMVSRDGSLQSHFFLKDSYRVLEFEFAGHQYLSKILIDALTGGSEAYLLRDTDKGFNPLNDGKVTTYDKAIEELLGSQELFFNSVFSGQKSKGIAELKPAERRKLFYELLNLNSYEQHLERSKDELNRLLIKKAENEGVGKAITEQMPIETIEELNSKKENVIQEIVEKEAEAKSWESSINQFRTEIQQLQVEARVLEDKQNQNVEILTKIDNCTNDVLLSTDGYNENVAKQIGLIAEFKGTIRNLEATISSKQEIESAITTLETKKAELSALQDKKTALLERNGIIQKEYSDSLQVLKKKEEHLEGMRRENLSIQSQHQNAVRTINTASKDAEILESVPCDEPTGFRCTFLSNAHASKKNLDFFESEERRIRLQLTLIENSVDRIEKEIISEKEMIEERYKVESSKLNSAEIQKQIEILTVDINWLNKQNFPQLAKQLQEAELNIALYKEKIVSAESTIDQYKASFEKALAEMKSRVDDLTKQLDNEIESKIDTISEKIIALQSKADSNQEKLNYVLYEVSELKDSIKSIDLSIDSIKKNQERLESLSIEKEQIEADIRDWTFLCKAFDKTGIPVLKLENSGIEITSIANDLLSLFENKFRIVFETTSLTKDKKKLKETFDINIIEEDGVCEISNKSGGQKVYIETAIRLAVAQITRQQGSKIETAFFDEADGALDTENARTYVEILRKGHVMSGVHNTFMITQRDELIDLIPQRIALVDGYLKMETN